jgi:hypothetical protein
MEKRHNGGAIVTVNRFPRRSLSSTAREALYDRCRGAAEFPTCNICDQLMLVGDAWDESHDPDGSPHCFGGTETGVAHRTCNRRHGAEVVRPMDAKATRNRQKHRGVPDPPQAARRTARLAKAQARRRCCFETVIEAYGVITAADKTPLIRRQRHNVSCRAFPGQNATKPPSGG